MKKGKFSPALNRQISKDERRPTATHDTSAVASMTDEETRKHIRRRSTAVAHYEPERIRSSEMIRSHEHDGNRGDLKIERQ